MLRGLPIGKPLCLFEHLGCPVNKPIHYTRGHAIHNHRPGDSEHLRADAQDEPFCVWSSRTHIFVLY